MLSKKRERKSSNKESDNKSGEKNAKYKIGKLDDDEKKLIRKIKTMILVMNLVKIYFLEKSKK